ncbi:hypothetical protein MXB_5621 [Myxobolus squamalis]|nr:hypothetical protein MXB_5621 [Myxobolus squamalis]
MLERRSIHLFIDCTFKCIPNLITLCMIILCYDDETSKYVTVNYCRIEKTIRGLTGMLCIYYSSQLKQNLSQQQ